MESSTRYGVPSAPSLSGALPTQRLQTQLSPDPPACVQNAMMTKDKKPFTYTPGGIDLSEIKSPRMAKRIARNAQYEGITGPPKPSPLAQSGAAPNPPVAPPMAAQGMPVQVIPSGPPPPPPAPSNAIPPPPPPQPMKNQLAPQTNGVQARKSPTPQNFEPPPLGCRPEIKIPPNPMATLKKVPKPREKNDFWVEEYRRDRSNSPMVDSTIKENKMQQPTQQEESYVPQYEQQNYSPPAQTQQFRAPSPPRQQEQYNLPVQQQSPQSRIESPFTMHDNPSLQRPLSPVKVTQPQLPQTLQQPQSPSTRVVTQTMTSPTQEGLKQQSTNVYTPSQNVGSPIQQEQQYHRQQQQQQQQPPFYTRTANQAKNAQLGSLYIPPVPPENLAVNRQQEQQQQQQQQTQSSVNNLPTPRWMARKPEVKEVPEWVRDENISPPAQRAQPMQASSGSTSSSSTPGPNFKFQINSTAPTAKEHIIPIKIEQSPIKTPSTPGFGPQPFYNVNQQFSSVSSPVSGPGYSSPNTGFNTPSQTTRNANQFTDQGYNNYQWPPAQQRITSPPIQQQEQSPQPSGTRIIPITIEGQEGPFTPNTMRGPICNSPMVIHNDPRSLQHQHSWSNGAPNQSKSFRILQKITDTEENKDTDSEYSGQMQRSPYPRPMGGSIDSPTEHMRRMQLNEQDQAFMNRVKNQVPMQRPQPPRYVQQRPVYQQDEPQQPYVHPSEQQVPEPKKYTGSAIPSRSFKILQAMTTPENAAEMEGSDVEHEQISRNNFYPYPNPYPYPYPIIPYYFPPPPDPNWHYPYPPVPYFYYYPEYDSQMYKEYWNGGYYTPPIVTNIEANRRAMSTPNIIVTPITEDEDNKGEKIVSDAENIENVRVDDSEQSTENMENTESALYMLSKKLNEISVKPELDMNISKDDKTYVGDNRKDLINSPSPVSNEKASTYDNNSDDAQSSDEDTSTSSLSKKSGKEQKRFSTSSSKDGLQAIKSVTDINVYDTDEEEEAISDDHKFVPIQNEMERNRNQNDDATSDCSYSVDLSHEDLEDRHLELEEYVSDEGDEITEDDVALGLSVIYEESEADGASKVRHDSHASTASTLSDCSTTIANDTDDDDSENELNAIEEIEDENPSLVTVRLPLKLSFSKSSNNENIATVVVGDSEIEDEKSITLSRQNCKSIDEMSGKQEEAEEEQNAADVSVTFNLSSNRSGSFDHKGYLSKTPSADSEISVSVSLPMMRDKFSIKSSSGDTTNDISTIPSNSDSNSSDEEKDNNDMMPDAGEFIDDNVVSKMPLSDSTKQENVKIDNYKEESEEEEESEHSSDEYESDTNEEKAYQVRRNSSHSSWNWGATNEENDEMIIEKQKCDETTIEETQTHSNETEKITQMIDTNMKVCDEMKESEESKESEEEEIENEKRMKNERDNLGNESEESEEESCSEDSRHERSADEEKSDNRDSRQTVEAANKAITAEEYVNWEQENNGLDFNLLKTQNDVTNKEDEIDKKDDDKKDEDGMQIGKEEGKEDEEEVEGKKEDEESDQQEQDESDESTESETEDETQTPVNDGPSDKKCEPTSDITVSPFNFPTAKVDNKEIFDEDEKHDSNEVKVCVRDRIAIFEAAASEPPELKRAINLLDITPNNTSEKKKTLSRNSSLQRSESELEEDDSGVTDMSKPMSETDTDPECFTELKKMTRYQRAATHSRLFKLLQEESSFDERSGEETDNKEEQKPFDQSRKKIVHNVSITRRTNPESIKDAETMSQRRERLSLPLKKTNSIDADNLSTSNSPSSPTSSCAISDKLVNELVQSLLLKKKSRYLKNLPMEKLQAAAKRVLEEDIDSLENTSLESTPALTPQETKTELSNTYTDYYDSWKTNLDKSTNDFNILPSKAFKNLQEQSVSGRKKPWAARCPRVLSSKTINRDLTRVTESPEMYRSSSVTRNTPEKSLESPRGGSLSRLGKV